MRLRVPAGRWSDCTPARASVVGHLRVEGDPTRSVHAPKRKRYRNGAHFELPKNSLLARGSPDPNREIAAPGAGFAR